jgi:hypothetical protein
VNVLDRVEQNVSGSIVIDLGKKEISNSVLKSAVSSQQSRRSKYSNRVIKHLHSHKGLTKFKTHSSHINCDECPQQKLPVIR